jgi:hypothetical protein
MKILFPPKILMDSGIITHFRHNSEKKSKYFYLTHFIAVGRKASK